MVLRFLTTNLGWKLFSLLLSVLLWFAFVAESETAASIAVPVEFRNMPRDLEITTEVADKLYLNVRGPSARMRPSDLAQASVVLNLGLVDRPGERTFTLDQTTVNLPLGISLTRVVPSQIRLRFEKRLRRLVPVEARFEGPPPQGYRVATMDITPPKLSIAGPESRVDLVSSVATDPIDLTGTVGSSEFRVSAYVSDAQVRFEGSPAVVVRVILEKIPAKQD
ncbi:MAG: CdaR family protein [Bryobacteraceae bacterium]